MQIVLTFDQVPELISQRRRWLNGSFFAAIHSTVKFHYIYRSSHSWWRKFWIHIQLLYQCTNIFFSWFSLVRKHMANENILTADLSYRRTTTSPSPFSASLLRIRHSTWGRVSTSSTSSWNTCILAS